MKYFRFLVSPQVLLVLMLIAVYWQFFFRGFIPVPADTLVGAYFPWYDYNWGYAVHVPIKNALISDVFSQFFLWKYLAIDLIKSGEFPLWNIYSFTGTPILATYHSAVLNPFNVLLFLPRYYGWGFYIFAQSLIAAFGMFVLLGKFTKNSAARISGALVFAFGGLMTTWTEFGTGVYAAGMLPWILFSVMSFIESGKLRYMFLMSGSFLFLYLAGHAQLTLYSSVLVVIYSLVFAKYKQSWTIISFLIIGVMMAMIQLLPAFEFTKESIRADENYASYFNFGLSPVYDLVRIFAADFFGNPATNNHWDTQSYHEQSSFLGSITLAFLLPLLFKKFRNKLINFWGGVFLVSLFLALDSPITRWFFSQPLPLLTYSSASRILFVTSFSGAILLGVALDKYFKDQEFFVWVRKSAFLFFIAITATAFGFFIAKKQAEGINAKDAAVLIKNYSVTLRNLILPALFTGIIALASIKLTPKKLLSALIVLIIFFDLGRYFLKYNPFVPQNIIFPDTPVTEFLKNQPGLFRVLRLQSDLMPPNTWIGYKLSSIEGYDPLYSEDYSKFFNVLNGKDYNDSPSRYREVSRIDSPLINALNVKYVLKVNKDSESTSSGNIINDNVLNKNYKVVFSDKSTVVYENQKVFDRAYFVNSVLNAKSASQAANILDDNNFDPSSSAVVIRENVQQTGLAKGSVEITKYTANEIEFKTESEGNGFLVFADNYDPGWKLLRDGQSAKIYKTNNSFRGIEVPRGVTHFKMYYWPDYVDLGIKLSLGGALIFFLSLIIAIKKRIF